jgi:small subunit ribosomal protein S17
MSETNSSTAQTAPARGHRKEREGEVISNKMSKTIVVSVQRRIPHPQFRKVVKRFTKFYAHDEKSEAQVGDRVRIRESRPLSKTKRWLMVEVINRNTKGMAVTTPAAAEA